MTKFLWLSSVLQEFDIFLDMFEFDENIKNICLLILIKIQGDLLAITV